MENSAIVRHALIICNIFTDAKKEALTYEAVRQRVTLEVFNTDSYRQLEDHLQAFVFGYWSGMRDLYFPNPD